GGLFCLPLILFAVTGGNMFQAWSVATNTEVYFGVPTWVTGSLLAVAVGLVILGGIRRIGQIAGLIVPFMCGLYVLCGIGVIVVNAEALPSIFQLIFHSAFNPAESTGAFIGAGVGTAFIFGMKRALFSSEAGLGSAPIAHSAVKTKEPVTEGIVAGLEPFIDTLVVCTITALVILSSGVWNRAPAASWDKVPQLAIQADGQFAPVNNTIPAGSLSKGETVFAHLMVSVTADIDEASRMYGKVSKVAEGMATIDWQPYTQKGVLTVAIRGQGVYQDFPGAALTAKAFDSAADGLGRWMVSLAIMLFALSTIITWSYYGEQGWVYWFGGKHITLYRVLWCALIVVPCLGFVRRITEIDTISTVALGFMLAINLPLMWLLGSRAMGAWKDYQRRLKAGEITEV
ncbi:MAG: alanine/glycine:cation symporter family protein, partial [Oceanococcaceae bacterium]